MADNNVNEMKLAKFESFIEKIRDELGYNRYGTIPELPAHTLFGSKINHYAQLVDFMFSCYEIKYDNCGVGDIKERIIWLKESVSGIKNGYCCSIAYIFVTLMSLAVDRTDYEERLSTVCDVAVMLDISDDEMADIVQVVRYVYRDIKAEEVALKTESCQKFFEKLIPSS